MGNKLTAGQMLAGFIIGDSDKIPKRIFPKITNAMEAYAAAASEWKLIEAADKTIGKREFIACWADDEWQMGTAYFNGSEWVGHLYRYQPTHYLPSPPPPQHQNG